TIGSPDGPSASGSVTCVSAVVVSVASGGVVASVVGVSASADVVVVAPSSLYSDTRAQTEAESIHARLGPGVWERTTANEQDASSIPAKLLWLRLHEPDVVDQADRLLLGAHSYVAWRACGEAVCDPTTASTTGLFDFEAGDWFAAAMEVAETSPALLPGLHEPYETLGALRVE